MLEPSASLSYLQAAYASQSPKETKTAVDNTFGKVPQNDDAKPAEKDAPKSPSSDAKSAPPDSNPLPAQDTKTAPASGDTKAAADTKALSDPKAPPAGEGKSAPAANAPASPKLAVTATQSAPAVDPKLQSILESKLADGKSVKEKLEAEGPTSWRRCTSRWALSRRAGVPRPKKRTGMQRTRITCPTIRRNKQEVASTSPAALQIMTGIINS